MERAQANVFRAGLIVLGVLSATVPALAIYVTGTSFADHLWAAARTVALEGLTFVIANILIGAARPLFNRIFRPRTVQRAHVTFGALGLVLIVGHAVMLLVFGLAGYDRSLLWAGVASLAVLALALLAAVARRRLRPSWKWIHRLSYAAFAIALVHGFSLGFDLGGASWIRIWFLAWVAVVASALLLRVTRSYRGR